jgi:hypothetical protein
MLQVCCWEHALLLVFAASLYAMVSWVSSGFHMKNAKFVGEFY